MGITGKIGELARLFIGTAILFVGLFFHSLSHWLQELAGLVAGIEKQKHPILNLKETDLKQLNEIARRIQKRVEKEIEKEE